MKKTKYILAALPALVPMIAFAATTKTLNDLIGVVVGYFNKALAILLGVAVIMFVFYVIKYFMQPNDKRMEGAKYVMWSILGFFVILSMWGLVSILTNTFGLDQNSPQTWSNFMNIFPK